MKYVVKCKLRECEKSASKVVLQEELCVAAFAQIFRPWDSHPRLHLVKFLCTFFNLELICWTFAQCCLFVHLHLVTDEFNREQGIRVRRALFLFISPELDRFRRHKLWRLTFDFQRQKTSIFGGSSTFWKEWRSFFPFIQLQYRSQAMNWIQWDWHRIMHHLLLKMQSTNIFDNRNVLLALVLSTLLVHRHVKSTIETQDWVRLLAQTWILIILEFPFSTSHKMASKYFTIFCPDKPVKPQS